MPRRSTAGRWPTPPLWRSARIATALAIASVGLAAATTLATTWLSSPSRVLLLAVAVLAAGGFVVAAMREILTLRRQRTMLASHMRDEFGRLLQVGLRDGRLPLLSELPDTVLGPTATIYTAQGHAPYVDRLDADAWLRDVLAAADPPFPFVILTGDSKAGKSRTVLHAARAALPDASVILPCNGQAAAEVMRLDPDLTTASTRPLVWLDDLRVGDLDHLTSHVLDAIVGRATIVATMSAHHWNEICYAGSEITTVARSALQRSRRFHLKFELTDQEKRQALDYYPDRQDELTATVASIAEVLVGGELLLAKYDAGRTKSPPGYALVQAAVDWRRCGLGRPVPRSDLDRLFQMYLRLIRIDLTPDRPSFDSGLSWAMEPVASQVALLRSVSPQADAWSALDYVVAAEDGQGGRTARAIPIETWQRILSLVPGPEGLDIGMAAHLRGIPDIALAAFRLAAACGHPDYASAGSFNLGVLLAEGGDAEGAKEAFETAIASGHPTDAPAAAVELGVLLETLGNRSEAIAAFQLAIASGHPTEGPRASELLAQIDEGTTNAQRPRADRHPP